MTCQRQVLLGGEGDVMLSYANNMMFMGSTLDTLSLVVCHLRACVPRPRVCQYSTDDSSSTADTPPR